MVKTPEIEEQLAAEQDDDCCEIDPAEFAERLNLKAFDDNIVIVAAKGQIKVKVEHFAKTLDGYVNSAADCLDTNGNLNECAAGDSLDNPYDIEEDETTLHKMESDEAKPVLDNVSDKSKTGVLSDGKCSHFDEDERRFEEVIPDMALVKCEPFEEVIPVPDMALVKCEPFEEVIPVPDMALVKCEPFEEVIPVPDMALVKCEPFEEVIPVPDMALVKCEPFEEVIPVADMSLVKCGPEDCNGVDEDVEEDAYDHIPEMDGLNNHQLYAGGRVLDEEDDDDFVVVGREAL